MKILDCLLVRRSALPLALVASLLWLGGEFRSVRADDEPPAATAKDDDSPDEKKDEKKGEKPDEKNGDAGKSDDAAKEKNEEKSPSDQEKTADAKQPKTHRVESGPFRATLEIEGTFEPETTTEYVLRLEEWQPPKNFLEVVEAVRHGSEVKRGESLVKLRIDDLEKAVDEATRTAKVAELDENVARIELASLEELTPIELASAERNVEYARDDLQRYETIEKPLELESAKSYLEYARFNVRSAEEELKQLLQMYEADDLTEETEEIILDRTKMMADMARVSFRQSEASHDEQINVQFPRQDLARKEALRRSEIALERTKTKIDAELEKARIALAKSELATAESRKKLAGMKQDLKNLSSIVATADGIVFYGKLREGSWSDADTMRPILRPGGRLTVDQVYLTVASPTVAKVRAEIDEKNLHLIKTGVRGDAAAVAYPDDSMTVRVDTVDRVPVSPGKFVCILGLQRVSDGPFVPGMKCKAELVVDESKSAIAIPKTAVFEDELTGDDVVYLAGDEPEKRVVKKGPESGDRVRIVSGLKAGDEILLEKPKENDE